MKRRIIVVDALLRKYGNLEKADHRRLIDAVWRDDFPAAHKVLISNLMPRLKGKKWGSQANTVHRIVGFQAFVERWRVKASQRVAFRSPDSQFLTLLPDMIKCEPYLEKAGVETMAALKDHCDVVIKKLVKTLSTEAVAILQEERLISLRVDLVYRISEASQSQSHRWGTIQFASIMTKLLVSGLSSLSMTCRSSIMWARTVQHKVLIYLFPIC